VAHGKYARTLMADNGVNIKVLSIGNDHTFESKAPSKRNYFVFFLYVQIINVLFYILFFF